MPCFILCPDCGENLGEIYDFIDLARQGYIKKVVFQSEKYKEFSPDKMVLNPNVIPPIGAILDAAELNNVCCRIHILGYSDFHMNYKASTNQKSF
jgi:DNA-directed RNA polymerase subunit N (RpoN/RPB10)